MHLAARTRCGCVYARSRRPLAATGATSIGTESREGGLLIRRGKQLEGAILLRETEGREGRREGTEREREGIALPQVEVSRINTVCQ